MNTMLRRTALLFGLAMLHWFAHAQDAAALQARYQAMAPQLVSTQFKRPLALASSEAPSRLSGDIYAVLDHSFTSVSKSLASPANWCDVLMLHLNTKYCEVKGSGAARGLSVAVGRKFDQPLADAQRVEFAWQPATTQPDYLGVRLAATEGPLSTRDYRIVLEAVPIENGSKSFIHLSYSYAYGTAARLAMQAYLGTLGSDKVGFTATGKAGDAPDYIGGVRGVVERNTMRYYLAIDAFLAAPETRQLDARLASWFDATEVYARQLHETGRSEYLAMKRSEYRRLKNPS